MGEYAIELNHVSKSFGMLIANQNISLHIKKGEIRALLGENGAGKSTLMKIIYGLYTADQGEIIIDGKKMPKTFSPNDAIGSGLSMVPQHVMLVDAFTVAENILLGQEQTVSKGVFSRKKANQVIEKLCEKNRIHMKPNSVVASLSLGEKQKIEILKALYRESNLIILDEPTAVLTPQETAELFQLLRQLKEKGITIIIIAHKLSEVMDIADKITIMRAGKKVTTLNKEETNVKELAELMVGRAIKTIQTTVKKIQKEEKPDFELINITTKKTGERCNLKSLSLKLYPGRILGIAGIDGNGQTDLTEMMAGVKKIISGEIEMDGKALAGGKIDKESVGVIPEDRLTQGLVLDFTIKDNLILRERKSEKFSSHGILKKKNIQEYVYKKMEEYDIRPRNIWIQSRFASGGNQQKIVIARELSIPGLKIVVASQPTRGLDIGAIEFAHQTLMRLREEGKTVLLISSDLDEIYSLSDYIAVLHDGQIMGCRPADEFPREQVGLCMGGERLSEVIA